MKKRQSSLTAIGIAVLRANEADRPAGERICDDPYARRFVGGFWYALMKFFMGIGYAEKRGPGVAGYLVARCRYIDDYLQDRLAHGLQQLVILGAGYDSRAYRFPQLQGRVRIFEVDHPSTQQAKLDKLRRIMGAVPDYVTYVPVDFDRDSLGERLAAAGYDRSLCTLFIWEGVTYYITPHAVDATLAFVAENAPSGSSIVFDYALASIVRGEVKRGEVASMRRSSRFTGERIVFGIEEGTIGEFLTSRGYTEVVNVAGEGLHRLYFTGANAKRQVAPVYAIVHATVK